MLMLHMYDSLEKAILDYESSLFDACQASRERRLTKNGCNSLVSIYDNRDRVVRLK